MVSTILKAQKSRQALVDWRKSTRTSKKKSSILSFLISEDL